MPYIVRSDSVLASTAAELLARHLAEAGTEGMCTACERPAPCPTARHADHVLLATPGPVQAAAPLDTDAPL